MSNSPVTNNLKSPQVAKLTTEPAATNDVVMVKVEKDSDGSNQDTNDRPNQTRFVH